MRIPKSQLPSTIQRSDEHAQALYGDALASAVESYGDGERAHRTAFSALKNQYEKIGDHWERKAHSGPSDAGAEQSGPGAHPTKGGVDANASKSHLVEVARRLDVHGRSTMTKEQLVDAIARANDRATAKAREQ